jgi:hypothetical protein
MLHDVSNRKVFIAILFILGTCTLFSQVGIKERVEIKPGPPLQKSSTENIVVFVANPDSNQGRHQEGAILVLYPCNITATATMDVQPGSDGSYPPTDLAMFSSSGGLIAWYKGYPDGTHGSSGGTVSYTMPCGGVGAALSNTMGYDDVTRVTRTISASSATIVFEGKLLRYWTFTATATLTATADEGYELASMELTADATQINQCRSYTDLHTKLRNKKGEVYNGIPCQNPPVPVTISVESSSDVRLSCDDQEGKTITLPYGDMGIGFNWNYQGETAKSTATVTLAVGSETKTTTIDLVVDTALVGLQFENAPRNLLHMLKTTLTVRGWGCLGTGSNPPPDGTIIDLEITEGTNWGFLRDPETGQQGTHLSSLKTKAGCVKVEYWAQGENPSVWEAVIMKAASGAVSAQCRIDILGAVLKVTLGRPDIGFGDTTKVVVERGNEDDGYTAIPAEWMTMYEIVEADTMGYFYAPDSSKAGSPLVGQYSQAMFFAKDESSAPDSVVLLLKVTAVEPYGPVWDIKATDANKPKQPQVMEKAVGGSAKGMKSSNGKVLSETEEPPNLGSGFYRYGVAQLMVKKKVTLDHFKVTLEKDTIAFTETSKIFVQAKDANDADISLPDEEKLTFVLEGSQSKYGRFIDTQSDTVLFVENARYSDAKMGAIKIASVHENPVGPVTTRIKVVRASDPNRSGESEIHIVQQIMMLLLYGPKEIWPVMYPYTQGTPHKDNCTLVEVRMTRNGKPLSNHPFKLSSDYVDGSGGHDHSAIDGYSPMRRDTTNDTVRFANYGLFVSSQPNAKPLKANPIVEQTLNNGRASFGYVASRFGDRILLKVESEKSGLLWDTISIAERVPNLELLPNSISYQKIGGTNQHHGPSDRLPASSPFLTPDNDHWGMASTLSEIDSIAAIYRRLFPDDSILYINDISLPMGGRFDIRGKWKGSKDHQYHRFGKDIDVRSSTIPEGDAYRDLDRDGEYDVGEPLLRDVNKNKVYDRNRQGFEDICTKYSTVEILLEDPGRANEHYHLFFWNRNQ